MKKFRIFYTIPGIIHKETPSTIVNANDAEEAVEMFNASHIWANVVAIFKA